jgi:hypothetical protein
MTRKIRTKTHSADILDYHGNLSMIDKEELVAKAKLKFGGRERTRSPSGLAMYQND